MKSVISGDHFDKLVCFPLWLLSKIENKKDIVKTFLLAAIDFGDVKSFEQITETKITVCQQLKIFARCLSKESGKAVLNSGNSYFVLLGVKISGEEIKFNLPGGKRHLSEDSFNAAMREMYEETSLFLSYSSFYKKGKKKEKQIIDSDAMRFVIGYAAIAPQCHDEAKLTCTSHVQLLPTFIRERCRVCFANGKGKNCIQSSKGCLNCKEIVCNQCFRQYDHEPSNRQPMNHHKKQKF